MGKHSDLREYRFYNFTRQAHCSGVVFRQRKTAVLYIQEGFATWFASGTIVLSTFRLERASASIVVSLFQAFASGSDYSRSATVDGCSAYLRPISVAEDAS